MHPQKRNLIPLKLHKRFQNFVQGLVSFSNSKAWKFFFQQNVKNHAHVSLHGNKLLLLGMSLTTSTKDLKSSTRNK